VVLLPEAAGPVRSVKTPTVTSMGFAVLLALPLGADEGAAVGFVLPLPPLELELQAAAAIRTAAVAIIVFG